MDIDVSSKLAKKAREYKLKPEEMGFADLVAVGWEPADAWACAIRQGATWNATARKAAIEALMKSEGVMKRIDDVRSTINKQQIEAIRNATEEERKQLLELATSKEQMLIDLQQALTKQTPGSKEWLDTKKLIVDVTRMKNDEVKEEAQMTHYHLPINYPTSCENCLLNPKNKGVFSY